MKIEEILRLDFIESENNSPISKEAYDELYSCYCVDGSKQYMGASYGTDGYSYTKNIYLYFKDRKLVYSCFSNHWGNFYDVNRGVIDYSKNYSN